MSLEARHAILDALLAVLDEAHAHELVVHRKAKKAALTPMATQILIKQFLLFGDPNAAVEEMINRNWTGFKADWMRAPARPGKPNAVDAMNDIFQERGWSNEPEFVPSDNGNGQRIPADHAGSQGAVVDLREGTDWNRGPRHH